MLKGLFGTRYEDMPNSEEDRQALAKAISEQALFGDIPGDRIASLVPLMRVKEFTDEEIVCHCPDANHDAFALLSGVVAVTLGVGHLEHVLQLEHTGAVFNTGPLVGADATSEGARGLGTVKLVAMDNQGLRELSMADPELGIRLAWTVCRLVSEQHDRQIRHLLAD